MFKTILYVLAFIALGIITASLGPTLPMLAAQTQTTTSQISWLFIARSMGTISGALVLGKLYDRYAGHPLLGGALVGAAGVFALIAGAQWLGTVAVLFVIVGWALALINVGGNTLIVLVHGARVGPFLSLIHFAYGLGGLLAPLVARPFAARAEAVRLTYLALAALIVPAGLILFGAASPALHAHGQTQAAPAKLTRPILLLLLFFFFEVGAEGAVSGWLFTYASARLGNEAPAFYINSAFWAAFTLGRLLSIPLALRFSERRLVTAHLLGWLTLSVLAPLLPNVTASLWVLAIGSGLGMAPIFPLALAWTQRTLHLSGQISGWILVAAALGAMILPWLVGQLFEPFGARVLFWLVNADLLLALGMLRLLLVQSRTPTRVSLEHPA
jgi:FHS family Na+ dependent glucose MFS transporter 1